MDIEKQINDVCRILLIWIDELRLCRMGRGHFPQYECELMVEALKAELSDLEEIERKQNLE